MDDDELHKAIFDLMLRERAVQMVAEVNDQHGSEWAAISEVAGGDAGSVERLDDLTRHVANLLEHLAAWCASVNSRCANRVGFSGVSQNPNTRSSSYPSPSGSGVMSCITSMPTMGRRGRSARSPLHGSEAGSGDWCSAAVTGPAVYAVRMMLVVSVMVVPFSRPAVRRPQSVGFAGRTGPHVSHFLPVCRTPACRGI